jgi:NADPH2:quinone reductase
MTHAKTGDRLRRSLVVANKRLLGALRTDQAGTVLRLPVQHGGFAALRGHTHCLVVTYRKDGSPVAQPVWPGYEDDRVYIWTEIEAFKAKRLRNDPRALIAPCTFRGQPLGPPIAALGRVLDGEDERRHAEGVIRSQWGWKRKVFEQASRPLTDVHYIELVPDGAARNLTQSNKAERRSSMIPDTMRAVRALPGEKTPQVVDAPVMKPADGDVLVKVNAAGVTPLEHSILTGLVPFAQLPLILGTEGSGRVAHDPSGQWSEGDRVLFFAGPGGIGRDGTYADYTVIPVGNLAAIPDGVDDVLAATIPVAYLTAALALKRARFSEGQSVLAPGVGGSVGNATVQLALALGASKAVSTAGSTMKAVHARELPAMSAVEVIDLESESLRDGLKRVAPEGVNVVVDGLAGPLLGQALGSIAPGGRYVSLGYSAGTQSAVNVTDIIWKGATLTGFSLFTASPADQAAAYEQVLGLIKDGEIKPAQDRSYQLDQADDAIRHLVDDRPFGKVALTI